MIKNVVLFFSILAVTVSTFGAEKVMETMSDETQKKYERKAVMGLDDLGFSQNRLRVPIQYCDATGKQEVCSLWSFTVDIPLDRKVKEEAADIFYGWTITNRFDKIIVGEGKARIETRGSSQVVDASAIPNFTSGTGSFSSFKSRLESYLNGDLKNVVSQLLSGSVQKRYLELPEREQETFMTTKAKEIGVPVEFIRKLMNSSYVFATHIEKIDGSGKITKKMNTVPLTKIKYPSWEISFDLPITARFLIYRYDIEKDQFVMYKELRGNSGIGTGLFDSEDMKLLPNHQQAMKAFNNTFKTSMKAAAINANYELKKDDNFAIFAPVMAVDGSSLDAEIGVMEDIRVDHPMEVFQNIDGKMVSKGYAKARDVFKNCGEEVGNSRFGLIKGDAEEYDLMREYPWTGLFFHIGGGMNGREIAAKEGSDDQVLGGSFGMFGLNLGVDLDLGYAFNSSMFSEFWLGLYGSFAFGGDDTAAVEAPIFFGGGIELSRRFYLGFGGMFIAPFAQIGYEAGSAAGKGINEDVSLGAVFFTPGAHIGFTLTPGFEIIAKGGWNLPFAEKIEGADSGFDYTESNEMKGGLNASINFQFHLPIVGPMSKFYSKPSKACKGAKKKVEKMEKSAVVKKEEKPALENTKMEAPSAGETTPAEEVKTEESATEEVTPEEAPVTETVEENNESVQ